MAVMKFALDGKEYEFDNGKLLTSEAIEFADGTTKRSLSCFFSEARVVAHSRETKTVKPVEIFIEKLPEGAFVTRQEPLHQILIRLGHRGSGG